MEAVTTQMSRVRVKINGSHGEITKMFEFDLVFRMDECSKMVRDKMRQEDRSTTWTDHVLFWPKARIFFEAHKTVNFYNVDTGTELEFRKRHRPLKVSLLDKSVRTVMIDETKVARDVIAAICNEIGLDHPEQMGLKVERGEECRAEQVDYDEWRKLPTDANKEKALSLGKSVTKQMIMLDEMDTHWLDSARPLMAQCVYSSEKITLKFRFFNKMNLSYTKENVRLNLLFEQGCQQVVSGGAFTSSSEAVALAALIMQTRFGDHDSAKHTMEFLDESGVHVVGPQYLKEKKKTIPGSMWKKITKSHSALTGKSQAKAKYRFVHQWSRLRSFGAELYSCTIVDIKKLGIIGFKSHEIIIMVPGQNAKSQRFPIAKLKKWTHDTEKNLFALFTCDDMVTVKSLFVRQMTDAIAGNISLVMLQMHQADDTMTTSDLDGGSMRSGGFTSVRSKKSGDSNGWDLDEDEMGITGEEGFEQTILSNGGDEVDAECVDDLDALEDELQALV